MADVLETIVKIFQETAKVLKEEGALASLRAGNDVRFDEFAVESITRFEMIMQIEDAYDIDLDDHELVAQETFLELVRLVESKVEEG